MPAKSKPAAAPAKSAPAPKAPAPAAVPKGGYIVLTQACPCRAGSSRANRWPLLVQFAGVEDGKAKLDAALVAGGFKVRAAGMLNWLVKAKHVQV